MFNPPVRGAEYIFYVSLVSQANTKLFKGAPTLATGDVKVSKDGGALANLATLPTNTPSASKLVKVLLSATEMDADNVTVIFSDVAGDEWCDLTINIQPSGIITAGRVNDVSASTTSFDTTLTEATDDHYNGMYIVFTEGTLLGQARKISDYDGTGKTITVATAFTDAPANDVAFVILGRSE